MNYTSFAIDTLLALELNDGVLPLNLVTEYTGGAQADVLAALAVLTHKGFVVMTPEEGAESAFTVTLTDAGRELIQDIAEYRADRMVKNSLDLAG